MKNTGHIILELGGGQRVTLPQLQNLSSFVSRFVSRDWQSAKKLIYSFWFQFKRLPLESDMSNCPKRKWHHSWIPTSLALCPTPSWGCLTTWTLPLLCSSIPLIPRSAIERSVSIPPGKGRLPCRITHWEALLPLSALSDDQTTNLLVWTCRF